MVGKTGNCLFQLLKSKYVCKFFRKLSSCCLHFLLLKLFSLENFLGVISLSPFLPFPTSSHFQWWPRFIFLFRILGWPLMIAHNVVRWPPAILFRSGYRTPLSHCRYRSLLQLLAPNDHQVFTHLTLLLQRIIHELSKYSFVCSFQLFLQFPCFLCYLITYTLEFHKFSSQHCFSLISTF